MQTPTSPLAGLATVKQALDFLLVSRSTLYRLERSGALRAVRLGRSVRYRWADLQALVGGDK